MYTWYQVVPGTTSGAAAPERNYGTVTCVTRYRTRYLVPGYRHSQYGPGTRGHRYHVAGTGTV